MLLKRLLPLLFFLTPLALADDSWRLRFYGEAPCNGKPGKMVYTVSSDGLNGGYSIPGYTMADYFRAIAEDGGKLPLTNTTGTSTFDVSGCGMDPVHQVEQATFAVIANPGGTGIYYVQGENLVNDYFCAGKTIDVKLDSARLLISGTSVDAAGTTRCTVAIAAPGGELPSADPSQPPDPNPDPGSNCADPAHICKVTINASFVLPNAAEKKFYSYTITASGGAKPYRWEILPADPPIPLDFPKGLTYSLSDTMIIQGTPRGNYPDDNIFSFGKMFAFRVRVTDVNGDSDTLMTSITVVPQLGIFPRWRPIVLDNATENASYFAYISANGGDDISYTKRWTITGQLPPGIVVPDPTGSDLIFRGRPAPGSKGNYRLEIKVDDGFTYPDSAVVFLNVFPARQRPLRVLTGSLPQVMQDAATNTPLTAEGGSGVYTWSLKTAAPDGLSLSASGVLSGRAAKGADSAYSFQVQVKDSDGKTANGQISLRVLPPPGSPLHISSASTLPIAYAGSDFTARLEPLGGYPPYSVKLDPASPPLPGGIRLSPDGALSGTPQSDDSTTLVFLLTDSKGQTSRTTLRLYVSGGDPPAITSLSPESQPVNGPSFQLRVSGRGFPADAVIVWNGQPLQTIGGNDELLARVPEELLTTAGAARVSARNDSGEVAAATFAILSAEPSVLTAPVAGANLSDTVTFEWLRSTATEYRIQVGDTGAGSSDLFDRTLPATAGSVAVTGLPLDGRTINVRLGSHMTGGWKYQDSTFTTVSSPQISRAAVTVTLVFTNSLLYPVDITVNGSAIGAVQASSTARHSVTVTPPLMVSIEMERPTTSSGRPLGDEFKGYYSPITAPAATENFSITNQLGRQMYFVPVFDNTTAKDRVLGVNMQLVDENRCNCVIPAYGTNVGAGYYKLYTNSNVRLYDKATPYSGRYTYWGSPDGTSANSFVPFVEDKTGRLSLTVK